MRFFFFCEHCLKELVARTFLQSFFARTFCNHLSQELFSITLFNNGFQSLLEALWAITFWNLCVMRIF